MILFSGFVFFFFKQKTAYEMRISDWSSDVCSSDLHPAVGLQSERTALPVADDAAGTLHHGGNRQVVIRLQAAVYYRVDLPRRELRIGIAVVGEALVAAGLQQPGEDRGMVGQQAVRLVDAEEGALQRHALAAGEGQAVAVAAAPGRAAVALAEGRHADDRSEERRVGKECVRTCQSRGG